MQIRETFKIITAAALMLFLTLGFAACAAAPAATVNGEAISEQAVTDRIMAIRNAQAEYADDAAWAQSLKTQGLTPQIMREKIITDFAHKLITEQVAQEKGVKVDEAYVNEQLAAVKANTGGDEQAWQEALKNYGYNSEAELRETLVTSNLRTQILAAMNFTPTDDELLEYARANYDSIIAGEAQADTTELIELGALSTDELDRLKEQWARDNQDQLYSAFMDERFESAIIVINEMPKGLPYDVVL